MKQMVLIHYCLQTDVKHKGGGKEEESSFCGLWAFLCVCGLFFCLCGFCCCLGCFVF